MGRDFFIDVMQLKTRSFANLATMQNELRLLQQQYNPQSVHNKYDSTPETNHGLNQAQQNSWNGYINKAFTQTRVPAVRAPDGASYKIRLREVLQAAGKL